MLEHEFNALAAEGYNRIPAHPRDLRRPRHPALHLPEARQRALHLPARIPCRAASASRALFLHRPVLAHPHRRSMVLALLLTGNRLVERRDYGDRSLRRRVHEPHQGAAAPAPAALRRRSGGLFRLRHRALHRAAPGQNRETDTVGTPDILLLLSEDRRDRRQPQWQAHLVVYAEPEVPGAYKRAQRRLRELLARLREAVEIPRSSAASPPSRCRASARPPSRTRCAAPSSTSSTATSCRSCCRSA